FAAHSIVLSRDPIRGELDEYERFGNRRLRTVGELIQDAFRVGLYRMERVVRERMTTEDVDTITPQTIINIRPVVAALKEFFGSSQLSQFMDQTNSLAGLTHRRRFSALGAGGLTRERAPIASVATALIPFLEHNDANRARMGANMQRQAVPLMIAQAPIVGTGLEYRAAIDSGDLVLAQQTGTVVDVDAGHITVETKDGKDDYPLTKFMR